MAKRVQARVPDETYDRLFQWSEKLGVTVSQLSGMSIQAGFDALLRVVSPMDSISPAKLAEVVIALQAKGVDVSALSQGVADASPKAALTRQ